MLEEIICVGLCVSVSAAPEFNIVNQEQKGKTYGIKLPLFKGGLRELGLGGVWGALQPPWPGPGTLQPAGYGVQDSNSWGAPTKIPQAQGLKGRLT